MLIPPLRPPLSSRVSLQLASLLMLRCAFGLAQASAVVTSSCIASGTPDAHPRDGGAPRPAYVHTLSAYFSASSVRASAASFCSSAIDAPRSADCVTAILVALGTAPQAAQEIEHGKSFREVPQMFITTFFDEGC